MNCSGILSVRAAAVLVIDCMSLKYTPIVVSWSGKCGRYVLQESRHRPDLNSGLQNKRHALTTTASTGRVYFPKFESKMAVNKNNVLSET